MLLTHETNEFLTIGGGHSTTESVTNKTRTKQNINLTRHHTFPTIVNVQRPIPTKLGTSEVNIALYP